MELSFSSADIPLILGMDQTGYIAREGGSVGILDRPKIKVLILREEGQSPAVLIFCDLLGLSAERTQLYAKKIASLCGTDETSVSIACTHSHAAPASMSLLLLGECRDSWFSLFEKELFSCVKNAMEKSFEKASVSYGKTTVTGVTRNRVKRDLTSVDPEETVLFFQTATQRIALVNYACHPVTLNADNRLYSKDFPAIVEQTILESGQADMVLFVTAPCGDLNPIEQDEPGKTQRMREYGEKIGKAAAELLEQKKLKEISGFSIEKLSFKLALSPEHARADYEASALKAAASYAAETNPIKRKYFEANFLWSRSMQCLARYGLSETAFDVVLTRIRLGELTIIGVPFELFSEIGIHLKKAFSPACIWELCGGNFGYFPSDELWDQAEYERGDAYMYYCKGGPLPKGSESKLLEALKNGK